MIPSDKDMLPDCLPVRLMPQPGESVRGFRLRLSHANGYPSTADRGSHFGYPIRGA
jgi:hypothetical protein